ncbi:DUF1989 domain-containing protein [Streptomyces asoensis]|uniref:DUF1989 domain-containing protein n=1 Tax=Streptomyces asoensis TaxID=249586 RepID=UPI0033FDF012
MAILAGSGKAVDSEAGRVVQVVDVAGGQVKDVFVFARQDPAEHHSAPHTRAYTKRPFSKIGEPFVTNERRPILILIADDSPGRHAC